MPKIYSTGDQILASEYNEVIKTAGLYTADAGASDTYAVTMNPSPGALAHGDVYRFRANTANTGAATLNVNSLGAKTIKKLGNEDLDTGDIKAGQMVEVQYDGTNFQVISQLAQKVLRSAGTTTRAGNAASGTQTIAHGLGRAPTFVRIHATWSGDNVFTGKYNVSASNGTFDGTNNRCSYFMFRDGGGDQTSNVSNNIVDVFQGDSEGEQYATATVDATNITLTWTRSGSTGADTIGIHWEAEVDA